VTATVRPMTDADVAPAGEIQVAAFIDLDRRVGIEPRPVTDAVWPRIHTRIRHFVVNDPAGSWVAVDGDMVIGCALALKREGLWGLSLLVVDPSVQSAGTGRKLLDASLTYAEGCDRAVILSSSDPRAIRSYATSGFTLYPQVEGNGEPDRSALPALHGRVRDGSVADVDLADDIDRAVRGAARGPDQVRLATDMTMFIADDVDGRGYAYVRSDGEIMALAASDHRTASALLWRCFAHVHEVGKPASVSDMNAAQQWAIAASFAARLKVTPAGPVFWRGIAPPQAFLPSGAYL
jgi:GNAT superfamily N-acetyltransferase